MSEAAITGAVVQALEPAAAQLLEDLHGEVSTELARLEAAIPPRLEAAETDVRLWAEDLFTTFHKVVASIDAKRGGASTVAPATSGGGHQGTVIPLRADGTAIGTVSNPPTPAATTPAK